MLLSVALLMLATCGFTSTHQESRPRRVVHGQILYSPSDYDTFYYITLLDSWSCVFDEASHPLRDCQENVVCGGALISPDFVLTAGHCLMYGELVIKTSTGQKPTRDEKRFIEHMISSYAGGRHLDRVIDAFSFIKEKWDSLVGAVSTFFLLPKPKHVIYSNIAMVGGSTNLFQMTQKRHAHKIFPDYRFPKQRFVKHGFGKKKDIGEFPLFIRHTWHDVLLIQACEAFTITATIRLAVMKRPEQLLKKQYENIVRTQAVCLYMGFGTTESLVDEAGDFYLIPTAWMIHTWRHTACSSSCYWRQLRPGEGGQRLDHLLHLECKMCNKAHGPGLGDTARGDSGGPVVCDGYYVAIINEGVYYPWANFTEALNYPVYCASDKLTPERLSYYRSLPADAYHELKPKPS